MLKIAMIAGEASGDLMAATLIKSLKERSFNQPIEFVGIGGRLMIEQGFNSWHNMETLSIMGYIEVIKSLPKLLKLRKKIIQQLINYKPDVFIGVDAPDFNFPIEYKLKQTGIKTIHYISPTIWAWRYERIYKIKRSTDLMLCIFPFEEAIYHKEGINARFVGHPIANSIEQNIDTNFYRKELNLPPDKNIFTILVGSRKREIDSLANILIETCVLINQKINNCLFLFPFANESTKQNFINYLNLKQVKFNYKIITKNTRDAIKSADMVIAKSGTVSLEAALCKKPMLIAYKVNKFTEWLLKRKIKIKYIGQPNILANREIIKEFLQNLATPQIMANYLINLFYDKSKQQTMIDEFNQLHLMLRQDASQEGAKAIMDLINNVNMRS